MRQRHVLWLGYVIAVLITAYRFTPKRKPSYSEVPVQRKLPFLLHTHFICFYLWNIFVFRGQADVCGKHCAYLTNTRSVKNAIFFSLYYCTATSLPLHCTATVTFVYICCLNFLAPTHGSKNQDIVLHLSPSFICFFFSRAVGYMTYGSAYRENIVDKLRKAAEDCDCLQCFFLIHSMGGGKAQRQFDPIHAWKQWCLGPWPKVCLYKWLLHRLECVDAFPVIHIISTSLYLAMRDLYILVLNVWGKGKLSRENHLQSSTLITETRFVVYMTLKKSGYSRK